MLCTPFTSLEGDTQDVPDLWLPCRLTLHMGEHNIRYEDIEAAAEENGRSVARPSTSWSARKPGTGATTLGIRRLVESWP